MKSTRQILVKVCIWLGVGLLVSLLAHWFFIAITESNGRSGWGKYLNRGAFGMYRDVGGQGFVNIKGLGPRWYVQLREDLAGDVFQVQYKYGWPYPEGVARRELDPSTLPSWSVLANITEVPEDYRIGFGRTIEQSGGWPFRAWYGSYTDSAVLASPKSVTAIPESSVIGGSSWDDFVIYPFGPVFPGVVLNTIFYGGTSWLVTFGIVRFTRRVRSAVRISRRRCIKCNYDVRGLDACPECGEPRPARFRAGGSGRRAER